MNEYMLVYQGGDPDWAKNSTPEEMGAAMAQWGAWMGGLQAKEQLVSGGSPLHYSGKNIDSDKVVTDIAASELKELVSGYSIIKAASIDAAVEIAQQCPIFNHAGVKVQVREIQQMG
ncbi:hypothetical protein A9R01_06650 ['Osedax' symbiont bacterium Rs2_46_30_T18]|nr:hypothetical protein A9R01_06650 ['Osedax' symbiont bacterium Rs2_46_30_T18]